MFCVNCWGQNVIRAISLSYYFYFFRDFKVAGVVAVASTEAIIYYCRAPPGGQLKVV